MKNKLKIFISTLILILLVCLVTPVFATGRLVDIPVPPNSAGYADFTEEEAAEREKAYEESKNNTVTAEYYVGKSSDNYLKSLNIEGYNLEPNFNRQNDTYTIYVGDRNINTFNVTAEADNENAKVEGIGTVSITPEENVINIQVTAENGNLKVYTINVEYGENRNETSNINIVLIIVIVAILILGLTIFLVKKRKINKKVE